MVSGHESERQRRGKYSLVDMIATILRGSREGSTLPYAEPRIRASLTGEQKDLLKTEGITAVYPLTGETIADQLRKGRHITVSTPRSLLTVRSLIGDVAFDPSPDKFFLPGSNKLTFDQIREVIAANSYKLQRTLRTDSLEFVLLEAPDYAALTGAHLDAEHERLFGVSYDFKYTVTLTPTGEFRIAIVGGLLGMGADRSLHINDIDLAGVGSNEVVWGAPAVVSTLPVEHK